MYEVHTINNTVLYCYILVIKHIRIKLNLISYNIRVLKMHLKVNELLIRTSPISAHHEATSIESCEWCKRLGIIVKNVIYTVNNSRLSLCDTFKVLSNLTELHRTSHLTHTSIMCCVYFPFPFIQSPRSFYSCHRLFRQWNKPI